MYLISVFLFFLGFYYVESNTYDVIILGAGVAGCGAAKQLQDSGVTNFVVLEAHDYIGGRVKNYDFENASLPLGAGWVHLGDRGHVMVNLMNKYGMTSILDEIDPSNPPVVWNRKTGTIFPSADALQTQTLLATKLAAIEAKIDSRIESGSSDIDLESALRWVGWNARTPLETISEYYSIDFSLATSSSKLSALSHNKKLDGDDYIINDPRGYIYPVLREIKPFESKFMLNKNVVRVKRNGDRDYSVFTEDNTEWKAKYVLVTFSTGVLNSNIVTFEPALPDWKKESLAVMPMSYLCKAFAKFSNKFWNDTTYILTASDAREDYFVWQDTKRIYNVDNMLVSFYTGSKCRDSHIFTDDQIADQLYNVLKDVYPSATKPTRIIRNTFNNDPKFMGSYSYQVPGVDVDDFTALEHPVQQGLWFAGEYVRKYENAYVHGAYQSGIDIAKKIIDCMRNDNCPNDSPDSSSSSIMNHVSFIQTIILFFVVYFFV